MIQRRQTIYLLTIVILGVILCFCPVVQLTTPETDQIQRMFDVCATGVEETTPEMSYIELMPIEFPNMLWLLITSATIAGIAFVDIFLFKKRILQARVNVFLAVVCLGYYAILTWIVWVTRQTIAMNYGITLGWDISFGACVPLVCLILTMGAIRLILRDEAMVRAADRIR